MEGSVLALTDVLDAYARGEADRDDLIEILIAWRYEPGMETNGFDDLLFDVPGSFDDVVQALRDGVIDAQTYDLLLGVDPERIATARDRVKDIVARRPSLSTWIETNRADDRGALARPGYLRHHDFCPTLRPARRGECTCWKSVVWQVTTRSSSSGADGRG